MTTRHEAFHGRPRTPAESLGKNHRYLVDLAGVFDLSGRYGDDRDAGRKKRVAALRVVGYALASGMEHVAVVLDGQGAFGPEKVAAIRLLPCRLPGGSQNDLVIQQGQRKPIAALRARKAQQHGKRRFHRRRRPFCNERKGLPRLFAAAHPARFIDIPSQGDAGRQGHGPRFETSGIAGRQCITAAQFEPDPHQIGKGQKRRHLQETCFRRACEYAAPNPVDDFVEPGGLQTWNEQPSTRFLHEASGTTRCSESDPRSGTTTSDSTSRPDASKSASTRDFAGARGDSALGVPLPRTGRGRAFCGPSSVLRKPRAE